MICLVERFCTVSEKMPTIQIQPTQAKVDKISRMTWLEFSPFLSAKDFSTFFHTPAWKFLWHGCYSFFSTESQRWGKLFCWNQRTKGPPLARGKSSQLFSMKYQITIPGRGANVKAQTLNGPLDNWTSQPLMVLIRREWQKESIPKPAGIYIFGLQ